MCYLLCPLCCLRYPLPKQTPFLDNSGSPPLANCIISLKFSLISCCFNDTCCRIIPQCKSPISLLIMRSMWSCPGVFFCRRMRTGSYLAFIAKYTDYLCRSMIVVLFLRPAGSSAYLCLQSPVLHCTPQFSPVSIGCPRCGVYLRLRFAVDDLCLRGAMQGSLTEESSHEAKFTRRQTWLSKCQDCHSEKILRIYSLTLASCQLKVPRHSTYSHSTFGHSCPQSRSSLLPGRA